MARPGKTEPEKWEIVLLCDKRGKFFGRFGPAETCFKVVVSAWDDRARGATKLQTTVTFLDGRILGPGRQGRVIYCGN